MNTKEMFMKRYSTINCKPLNLTGSKIKQNLQNIYKSSSAKDLLKHRFSRKIRENQSFGNKEALIVKLKYKPDEK